MNRMANIVKDEHTANLDALVGRWQHLRFDAQHNITRLGSETRTFDERGRAFLTHAGATAAFPRAEARTDFVSLRTSNGGANKIDCRAPRGTLAYPADQSG